MTSIMPSMTTMTATTEMTDAPRYRFIVVDREVSPDRLRLSPVTTEAVAETSAMGRPAILIRRQLPYILLGPQDRRLPTIREAVAWAEAAGYPTYMRIGGGSAVLLDDHCLSFGVARPCRDLTTLERNYRELAGPVVEALRDLGVPAVFGAAAGSFCEGPWDIVADGVKVAGIAQAIRGGYTLVSGMILLDQDPVATTAVIQEIYRRAGSRTRLNPDAVSNVRRLTGRLVTHEEMTRALYQAFSRHFALEVDVMSETEWARAATLITERRFLNPASSTLNRDSPAGIA
jgi:octanoyl-[GcvH]:protein N-octanoyltransferase